MTQGTEQKQRLYSKQTKKTGHDRVFILVLLFAVLAAVLFVFIGLSDLLSKSWINNYKQINYVVQG